MSTGILPSSDKKKIDILQLCCGGWCMCVFPDYSRGGYPHEGVSVHYQLLQDYQPEPGSGL